MNNIDLILQQLKNPACNRAELLASLQNGMTAEQKAKAEELIRDKSLREKLLSSPEAMELLRKLGGNNGC